MLSRSSWRWSRVAALGTVLLACAAPASRAKVLLRLVTHTVQEDGSLLQDERVKVRLDTDAEVERWSSYSVTLDEYIKLEKLTLRATRPDGETVEVSEEDQSEIAPLGEMELHSSTLYRVASFDKTLPVGTIVIAGSRVRVEPRYPSGRIYLRTDAPVEELKVLVQGASEGWRYRITGPADGLELQETGDGIKITAEDLPGLKPLSLAPPVGGRATVLDYAWGGEYDTWNKVGEWYQGYVDKVPRNDPEVAALAKQTIAGLENPWDRLNALAAVAQKDVRYVAVEVGEGGLRPSPPKETLERSWGDCKDKSLLLVDLLQEAQIEAYPALIHGSTGYETWKDFPTDKFNHLIVAVPRRDWMPRSAPLHDGYLFVDATQTQGRAEWLAPFTQDQNALVVRGEKSELVRTPILLNDETRRIEVELRASGAGTSYGDVKYRLTGAGASGWLTQMEEEDASAVEQDARDLIDSMLPGCTTRKVSWEAEPGDLPSVTLRVSVSHKGLVEGTPDRRAIRLGGYTRTPDPRILKDRRVPVVIDPIHVESTWKIRIPPDWCLPKSKTDQVENELGRFSQRIFAEPGLITVRRDVELRNRWIEPDRLDDLKALSLAEHRAYKRRIRLRCPKAD